MASSDWKLRKVFKREVLPHLDPLYSAAYYLTGDQASAADLCRETILLAYRSFGDINGKSNRRTWLLTILSRAFRSGYPRTQSAHGQQPLTAVAGLVEERSACGAFAAPQDDSGVPDLARALLNLPRDCKAALLLVDIEGLTYQDAATVLEIPFETIRSRVAQGRALMRAALRYSTSAQAPATQ